MTLTEAIATLEEFNAWRLGAETEQLNPRLITDAIYSVLNVVKQDTNPFLEL